MKMTKWIALILALCMVLYWLPPTAIEALAIDVQSLSASSMRQFVHVKMANPLYTEGSQIQQYMVSNNSAGTVKSDSSIDYLDELDAVTCLRQNMVDRKEQIAVNVSSTSNDAQAFVNSLVEQAMAHTGIPTEGDSLRWQWSTWDCDCILYGEGDQYYYTLTYTFEYYTTDKQEAAVDAAIVALLDELNVYEGSDYTKVKAVYDWLCANVTYDYDNLEDDTYKLKYTPYAALMNCTSVCQGYALLFYRLALELEVDCRLIAGNSRDGAHSWNIVKLGGQYYNLDATWDATLLQQGVSYRYFLRSNENFIDHDRDVELFDDAFDAQYPIAKIDYDAEGYWISYAADHFAGGDGSLTNPYLISSAEELALFALKVNNSVPEFNQYNYRLIADIDLSAHEWIPIGYADYPEVGPCFSGTFDGNGHTISGMKIYTAERSCIGLFGIVYNGTIENLYIKNSVIDIKTTVLSLYIGGLVGYMMPLSYVEDVSVTGNINACCANGISIGGLVGELEGEAYVCSSSFCGSICSEKDGHTGDEELENQGVSYVHNVGGLIGGAYFTQLVIENCYSMVDVSAKSDASLLMGGAIGWINIIDDNRIEFQNVYATATMTGSCQSFEDTYCGLFNGGSTCYDNKIDKIKVDLGSLSTCRVVVLNCGYFAHDIFYKYAACDAIGQIELRQKGYHLSEMDISDFFVNDMCFDASVWNVAAGYYPTLAGQDSFEIPSEFDHDFVDQLCIYCGAVDKSFEAHGTWGDNLTWEIVDGTLTIDGEGPMTEGIYNAEISRQEYPWTYYGFDKVVIGSGVTTIGELAFFNCNSLTNVVLDGVARIEYWAFYNCTSLTSVTLHEGVLHVGGSAFYNCTSLTSVTIPASVNFISPDAFRGCTGLTQILVDEDNQHYSSDTHGVLFDKNKTKLIIVPSNFAGMYSVPESVTSIGYSAFRDCIGLTNVTFGNRVISIGDSAFQGCKGLTTLMIPNSVTSIGQDAFLGCSNLTSVTLPNSITSINWGMFNGCVSLSSITIPSSVTSIGDYAFNSCTSLISVEIPESVSSLGASAFGNCRSLSSITNGGGIISIGDFAFECCYSLRSITISDSVTSIGAWTFVACYSLTSVTIGEGLTSVGQNAFDMCYNLARITFEGNAPTIGEDAFCAVVTTVCYPCENDSWNSDVMQDYGGEITWIPYSGDSDNCDNGHIYVYGECIFCGTPEYVLGDANGDGKIDTTDAKLIMQYDLGLIGEDAVNLAAMDVNGDGYIDTTDAKLVMQLDLGIITEFPKP